MKTAIEIAEKEIAELWSSPSDQPTYTQIFEVLERVKPIFKEQIIEAYSDGMEHGFNKFGEDSDLYYTSTFTTNKETLR